MLNMPTHSGNWVLRTPITDITSVINNFDMNGDGSVMAIHTSTSSLIRLYNWDALSNTWTQQSSVPSMPTTIGNGNNINISDNGQVLMATSRTAPYLHTWYLSGGAYRTSTLGSALTSEPTSGAVMNKNATYGIIARRGVSPMYNVAYQGQGTSWASVTSGITLIGGSGDIYWSRDGKVMMQSDSGGINTRTFSAIGFGGRNYLIKSGSKYSAAINSDGSVVAFSTSSGAPEVWLGTGTPINWSNRGYIPDSDTSVPIMKLTDDGNTVIWFKSGYLKIYDYISNVWAVRENVPKLPVGTTSVTNMVIDSTLTKIAVQINVSPWVAVYDFVE